VAIASAVVIITSVTTSTYAISQGNKEAQALKDSLTVTETEPVITDASNPGLWVTGDSVILGIRHELGARSPIGLINARVGRQAGELKEVIAKDLSTMNKSTIVFNLGNNNALTRTDVEEIFELIKHQPKIIVVNTAVPRPWKDPNNALIKEIAAKYWQVSLVDWAVISDGHPEYFAPDGVHLVASGVTAYVNEIEKVL